MNIATPEDILSSDIIPDGETGKKQFIQSLYTNADTYYNSHPWKFIPGW